MNPKRISALKKFIAFLLLTIVIGSVAKLTSNHNVEETEKREAEHVQSAITKLDAELGALLQRIANSEVELSSLRTLWAEKSIGLVIYERNNAVHWTTNSIPFAPTYIDRKKPQSGIVKLQNSWYLCQQLASDDDLLVAYALLRTEYEFENRYVQNNWAPTLSTDNRFVLSKVQYQDYPITLSNGAAKYGIRVNHSSQAFSPWSWKTLVWLVFIAFILLTIWFAANWVETLSSYAFSVLFLLITLGLLRWLMLWWELPSALYTLELFSPTQHATSTIIPSLGDYILHLIFGIVVALKVRKHNWSITNPILRKFVGITVPVMLIWPVNELFEILVFNSSFSLDLNSPFALNEYSILGLIASFLVLFIYHLAYHSCIKLLDDEDRKPLTLLPFIAVGTVVSSFLIDYQIAIATGILFGFIISAQEWLKKRSGVYFHAPNVLVFSILACLILTQCTTQNEHDSRQALARKLDQQQNPITEYLFDGLANEIATDRQLRLALSSGVLNAEDVLEKLHQKLSYDHWNAYESFVDVFNSDGGLLVSDRERTGPNFFELQSTLEQAKPTISKHLKYVNQWSAHGGYLARVDVSNARSNKDLIVFVTLIPEKSDDILGFTDLFVDEEFSIARELEGYSYALYQDGELQERNGDFPYGLMDTRYQEFDTEITCFNSENYSHLVSKPIDGRVVVVSKPENGVLAYLTTFSYLFLFYLLCAGVIALVSGRLIKGLIDRRSFRNRINLAMTSVSFISLVLIGVLTVFYVIREYNARNKEMISEKTRSVLIELEHKLRDRQTFTDVDKAMLATLMVKFSKVFFTDINLYQMDGHLLATSRPRLFDEGLMSKVMDPEAYEEMRFGQRSSFIHEETIGNLTYLTAYVPFRNDKREVIAFMSLPYFARQYGLQQEIFALLATLTNIYVFLILISVVLALVISNRITEPLRFIRESLKNLKLNQANRAIDWQSNDEIGELVDEYNRTLNELVQSAELLAKSEREMAWREMAKQVAHEIKNPLTPMKLSIQMLQRSMKDGADDLDERIERTSKTLIEQIDTLSNIATEFSTFAKMPKSVIETVDLTQLLESTSELYRNSDVSVLLQIEKGEKFLINADREQMLRVFNNLIKNGIQAVSENDKPIIKIGLKKEGRECKISISDNGSGIPEELRDKIFVPNFTTKTSGMGLGLAMVKNIVESANGDISFQSETGNGTTFYASLPLVGDLELTK